MKTWISLQCYSLFATSDPLFTLFSAWYSGVLIFENFISESSLKTAFQLVQPMGCSGKITVWQTVSPYSQSNLLPILWQWLSPSENPINN